ncbi:MAG: ABC transporter substrate-binding protein [Candidatus Dormibacteraceae bacterium]
MGTNSRLIETAEQFLEGRLSRRQLLVRMAALGVSLSAIPAILEACGNGTAQTPVPAASINPATLSGTVKYYKGPFASNEAQLEATMVAAFNAKYPHVTVEVEQFDWPSSAQQITTSLSSGSHDVYYLPEDLYNQFQATGQLANLTNYVNDPNWKAEHDQIQFWDSATAAGEPVMGVPYVWLVESHLAYNKDMFSKAGIGSDWNSSYTKLLETATTLNTGGNVGLLLRNSGGANYGKHDWYGFILRSGTDFLDASHKPALNTPNAVQSIQFLGDLFNKYKVVAPFGKYTWDGMRSLFIAGKAGMIGDETTIATTIAGANPPAAFDWELAAWPPGPANQDQFTYRGYLVMSAKSANKDAAWEMMKFWSAGSVVVPYFNATSIPSVRKDAVSLGLFSNSPKVAGTLSLFAPLAKGPLAHPKFDTFLTNTDALIDQVYAGRLSASAALSQADSQNNQALSG